MNIFLVYGSKDKEYLLIKLLIDYLAKSPLIASEY